MPVLAETVPAMPVAAAAPEIEGAAEVEAKAAAIDGRGCGEEVVEVLIRLSAIAFPISPVEAADEPAAPEPREKMFPNPRPNHAIIPTRSSVNAADIKKAFRRDPAVMVEAAC